MWHCITNGSLNLSQTTKPYNKQQKEIYTQNCELFFPADQRVKLNENKKKDKYHDIARELKKSVEYENYFYTNCN